MLVIETLRRAAATVARDVARMPRIVHVGLALAVAAFVLDLAGHLGPQPAHHHDGFHVEEHLAHLVGLIAMAVILAGVVIDGIRRQQTHRRRTSAPEGGPGHAHR